MVAAVRRLPGSASRIAGWTLRRGAAGDRLVHPAAGRARGRHQPQPHRRWWSTSARARSTSCCSSPRTRSSWCPPRASSRGGATNVLTGIVHLRLRLPPAGAAAVARRAASPRWCCWCTSALLLYSLWILTVSAAFYVVKVDNLTYFFSSIFDAARWPSDGLPGRAGLRLHVHHPAGADDDLPRGGDAGTAAAHLPGVGGGGRRCVRLALPARVALQHRPVHLGEQLGSRPRNSPGRPRVRGRTRGAPVAGAVPSSLAQSMKEGVMKLARHSFVVAGLFLAAACGSSTSGPDEFQAAVPTFSGVSAEVSGSLSEDASLTTAPRPRSSPRRPAPTSRRATPRSGSRRFATRSGASTRVSRMPSGRLSGSS